MISTPQTVSRLNKHVTVHIQSKVIIWSCGKKKRAVLIPGPFPLLTRVHPVSSNPRLLYQSTESADGLRRCMLNRFVVHNKEEYIEGIVIDTNSKLVTDIWLVGRCLKNHLLNM